MKFSIIGCQHAHIGAFLSEMLEAGHTCAGIYEQENLKLAKSIAEQHGVPLINNMDELLADDIEVVGCAAINNEKIDIVELCEKHGKHIMLDKPAATNRDGLDRLKAVVERGKIQVGLMLTERFRSSIYTLKNMIEKGELGQIVNIAMRKPHRLTPANRPAWHFSKEQGGGIIVDLFIHDVDLLRWLTGNEMKSVQGVMSKSILPEHKDFYDAAHLHVVTDQGITAHLYADWHNPEGSWTWGDCRIYVTGTEGVVEIRLEGDPLISKDELLLKVTHQQELINVTPEAVPANVAEDFLNRIEGKPSLISHEDIILATEVTIEADEKATIIDNTK